MKLFYSTLFFIVVILSSTTAQNLQSELSGPREDGNIEEQMDFLIQKSNNYKEYKVIPKAKMQRLKSNVLDSLAAVRNRLRDTRNTLSEKNGTISSLNTRVESLQSELGATNEEKDSISFLGMNMGKGAYKTFMWLIIGGLAALLGLFVFKFRESNVDTVTTKKDLEDLQKDFEDHRKRSLEREQKAMRKLQDELNRKGSV